MRESYQTPVKMADIALKAILIVLTLCSFAEAQHLDEDKRTLIEAGLALKNQEQKSAIGNTTAIAITTVESRNATDKVSGKLREYKDHAEIQMETEKPEESTTIPTEKLEDTVPPPTPSPEPVNNDLANEELDQKKKDPKKTMTEVPAEPLPTPVPVLQNSDEVEGLETKEKQLGIGTTKKPTVVKKGGVVPQKPSVYARKGVSVKDDNLPSESSSDSSSPGLLNTKTTLDIASGPVSKSMATDLNTLADGKKKGFDSPLSEANMDFVATKPSIAVQSVTTVIPESRVPSPRPIDSVPVKPPTTNPLVTKGYTKGHPKPTAATDTLNVKATSEDDDSNISYTPVVVGIVLLVAIVVTVIVVGYRRLQDVWMRRHYARMDFLIDGMYDV